MLQTVSRRLRAVAKGCKNILPVRRQALEHVREKATLAQQQVERQRDEIDTLYRFLYNLVHDLEDPLNIAPVQSRHAFAFQWKHLKEGNYLLSDPWFRAQVDRILCEEELLIRREWFRGKEVLDAGCGNGRWSYGFARLGSRLTAVDVNDVAIAETREALREFSTPQEFHVTRLEEVADRLAGRRFDLVFCWGVLHHCGGFNKGLEQLSRLVKDDGILYLYLYGRDSLPYDRDVDLFKTRLRYNVLETIEEKLRFLRDKANGDEDLVHNLHDVYAPLVNRRLEFERLQEQLTALGFQDVRRTIEHTELFVRALKAPLSHYEPWLLPPKQPPYWFQHH